MLTAFYHAMLCLSFFAAVQGGMQASVTVSEPGVDLEPNPAVIGQIVTFYWPSGTVKVLAAGGGFGPGTILLGDTPVTDTPKRATSYRFDVWYWSVVDGPVKGPPAPHMVHRQYWRTLQVYAETFPPLTSYHDWRRWQIDYVRGWNRYATPEADPANNAVIYFQPAEDSVERVVVAITPADVSTSAELMQQVLREIPTQYDVLENIQEKETTHCSLPARWMTFEGVEQSHPDIRTHSIVLAFVRDGKGYVISARTYASHYDAQEPLLRNLVRSFAFVSAPSGKKPQ